MSFPDKALFYKKASVNIAGTVFTYPPFSIEFSQTLKVGKIATSKVKLYNPSPATIKLAESTKQGKTRLYSDITVEAGYIKDYGTAVLGEIMDYSVQKKGADTVLEMSVSDKTSKWANAQIGKTWRNTMASTIIFEMLEEVGITSEINLGEDKTYPEFTATKFRVALKNIVKDTASQFNFKNGVLKIEPEAAVKDRTVLFVSPESGLLGKIEKNAKGFKFRTLFFYKLQIGDIIKIKDKNTPSAIVKIIEGKKNFATFRETSCTFKAVEI